ncbi:MAG: sensor histidine kinase [Flavobacteriales bacterium]
MSMSKERSIRTERTLVFGTAGVLLLAVGFAFWSIVRSGSDSAAYLDRSLEGQQQLLHVRLSGLVHELEQALVLERSMLQANAVGSDPEQLLEHWRPLLEGHWSLSKVAVADEYGNETALLRKGDVVGLRRTVEGSQHEASTTVELAGLFDGVQGDSALEKGIYDPRTRVWFGKALEDARDTPIWTFVRIEEGGSSRLQLSLLVRASDANAPFRVVMFEADPERISWLDQQRTTQEHSASLVMNSDGHILNRTNNIEDEELRAALISASEHWNRERNKGPFKWFHMEKEYMASFSPYALNGETLYTGILMDTALVAPLLQNERSVLYTLASLLSILCALLGTLWWRGRAAAAEVRKQERRSRSQELRLAKVLGEREVLNREVHHRVKNNLQVVSSLLNLQAIGLDDGPVREEFLRGKQRIDTIALVHHKLYALKDLRNVDLGLFFDALTQASAEYNEPHSRTVSFDVDTQGLKCDQDTAIGLGIILCELMANAFRHAFPYATGGHIDVQVQAVEGDLHRLVVKDNGKGLDPDSQNGKGKLGLEIVEALADQLDGSFHTRTNGGTTFEVLFRMRPVNGSANAIPAEADSLQ